MTNDQKIIIIIINKTSDNTESPTILQGNGIERVPIGGLDLETPPLGMGSGSEDRERGHDVPPLGGNERGPKEVNFRNETALRHWVAVGSGGGGIRGGAWRLGKPWRKSNQEVRVEISQQLLV